mmetsp:Transcript_22232/g.74787  ORF Transcript_22232/g.74787 Transcript_22232/m.74787 type:complete len:233 (+) Transcript_22232:596-1294(+)
MAQRGRAVPQAELDLHEEVLQLRGLGVARRGGHEALRGGELPVLHLQPCPGRDKGDVVWRVGSACAEERAGARGVAPLALQAPVGLPEGPVGGRLVQALPEEERRRVHVALRLLEQAPRLPRVRVRRVRLDGLSEEVPGAGHVPAGGVHPGHAQEEHRGPGHALEALGEGLLRAREVARQQIKAPQRVPEETRVIGGRHGPVAPEPARALGLAQAELQGAPPVPEVRRGVRL